MKREKTVEKSKNPVVLVHGIGDTGAVFEQLASRLSSEGKSVYTIDLVPSDGTAGLDRLAHQVAEFVGDRLGSDRPFDLVGFSMGGLVARYYVQRLGGVERVERLITISSPHQGTWTAYALDRVGCHQMRPNSEFLLELDRDARDLLGQIDFTSIWTPYDLMILPARSSQLSVGTDRQIPVALHSWMLEDLRCIELVVETLSRAKPDLSRDRSFVLQ
ncbi:lipase [Leptolyngbya valderiana BDU 20041]|nr:triacylglycerol lipase [Geitlerinema sp. CS-897]OAB61598.1 lipase [Leptolyngbya valderiana BDU 20041]PPT07879.1 Lipase like family protein [Geitlerinema sp. FC II]